MNKSVFRLNKEADDYITAFNKRKNAREILVRFLTKVLNYSLLIFISSFSLYLTRNLVVYLTFLWVPVIFNNRPIETLGYEKLIYFSLTVILILVSILSLLMITVICKHFYRGFISLDKEKRSRTYFFNAVIYFFFFVCLVLIPYYLGYYILLFLFDPYLKNKILSWSLGSFVLFIIGAFGTIIKKIFLLIYHSFRPLPDRTKKTV